MLGIIDEGGCVVDDIFKPMHSEATILLCYLVKGHSASKEGVVL
jgi:hypothetical protein